jgi:hypothetical protein
MLIHCHRKPKPAPPETDAPERRIPTSQMLVEPSETDADLR